MTSALAGYQKKYLKSQAHDLKPVVFIGQKGLTAMLLKAVREALQGHELIKVKFIEFKEKDQKKGFCQQIEEKADCALVGLIGHMAMFYRPQSDPAKRKIRLPLRDMKSSSAQPD
jgi:RNA-binding protein